MQKVIDIPKDVNIAISRMGLLRIPNEMIRVVDKAIQHGTPLKTGHWIGIDEKPHEDYECDNCGYVVSTFTANIKPHTEYKYCPNCGAKMESEVEE